MEASAVVSDTSHGLRPGRLLGFDSAGQQEGEPKEGENCSHDSLRKKVGWNHCVSPLAGPRRIDWHLEACQKLAYRCFKAQVIMFMATLAFVGPV
jgi:hypothetical protein